MKTFFLFLLLCSNRPSLASAASLLRSLDRTHARTHTHINTLDRTPLKEWSTHRRGRHIHNTHTHTHTKYEIHAISGIRTRDFSSQAASDRHLTLHSHRHRAKLVLGWVKLKKDVLILISMALIAGRNNWWRIYGCVRTATEEWGWPRQGDCTDGPGCSRCREFLHYQA